LDATHVSWIGYRFLSEEFRIVPVQAFVTISQAGAARKTETIDGVIVNTIPRARAPGHSVPEHLIHAIKNEGIHLEFLARVFARIEPHALTDFLLATPNGVYTRRLGFFYEWLTGRAITGFPGVGVGNYVNALDPQHYFVAQRPVNNQRWRVRDNLPGTANYCPTVRMTPAVNASLLYPIDEKLVELEAEFGPDLIARSARWLTHKESMQSFAIEREQNEVTRIQRFAWTMEFLTGKVAEPLSEATMKDLQDAILGESSLLSHRGLRRSPVFVGTDSLKGAIVHYIGPHWDHIKALLDGLDTFDKLTSENPTLSIIRAAVLSFGFVYIHPLVDGNGRISRFLINDTLRRDGAVPRPFILPVSATITSTSKQRSGYDNALEQFSAPLMRHYAQAYRFGQERKADDGRRFNIEFDAYEEALPAWQYPDFTFQAEYLADIIRITVEHEMRGEAAILRDFHTLRAAVKELIDGPDAEIDRIVRSIRSERGTISNKLKKEFPRLADAELSRRLILTVMSAAAPELPGE
jgi:hypothetical protein